MQHPDEGTIHSWLDGALSADEAARIEEHVKACPECAVAVAEARGFIAASSRILTALDNAPRGVIPAAAPKKRIDPMVWRVAATVLVVAAGTFVVVRDRGSDEQPTSVTAGRGILLEKRASLPEQAPSAIAPAQSAADVAAPKTAATKAPAIGTARKTMMGDSSSGVASRDYNATANAGVMMRPRQGAASPGYAGGAAPTAPTPLVPSGVTGGVAMDATNESEPLKVVGTPQRIGAKVTLYEIAPGDTVTLTEAMPISLDRVVVTSAGVAPMAAQAAGKSVVLRSKARADTAATGTDSQRTNRLLSVPAVSAPAPISREGRASPLRVVSWTDPATGNTLTLTGRMPEARLQEIKIRIERERAAAAAAKKKP
jgi:hypothetical protein